MIRVDASAPGKMLITGEYAVLDGAPAIACSVQRRALATWADERGPNTARGLEDDTPRFPEAAAARQEAEQELGFTIAGELDVDVRALRTETTKLGVGSSAAAAAAAAGAVFATAGHDLKAESVQKAVLGCALRGHAAVAPRGSGVDVAASVLGGTIRYVREPLSAEPIAWPEALIARVVWTGKAASTREFLDRIAAFRAASPEPCARLHEELRGQTDALARAFGAADGAAIVSRVPAMVDVLRRLGEAADAPIVEEELEHIARLAQAHRGAAKPSGAGGGDVALAFFTSEGDADGFTRAIAETHLALLDVELGGPGVRAET